MAANGEDLAAALDRWRGRAFGGIRTARDPVNLTMIRHWVQAVDDANPVYVDEAAARATGRPGPVAPPAMLQVWTMDSVADPAEAADEPEHPVLDLLAAAGYPAVVATDYSHEYLRELTLGDRISRRGTVEEVSARKRTALGPGFFVTLRYDYADAAGTPVGVGRMRLLAYRSATAEPTAPPAGSAAHPRPAVNRDTAHFWAGTRRGELPIQRCTGCRTLRHPPAPMCGRCRGTGWDTVPASGRGHVYSFVVHHHPPLPGLATPHVPVLVELEEGVRMVSYLTGPVEVGQVRIGAPVEVVFRRVDDELTLPLFRLAP